MKRTKLFMATRIGIHLSLAGSTALWAEGDPSSSVSSVGGFVAPSLSYSEMKRSTEKQTSSSRKRKRALDEDGAPPRKKTDYDRKVMKWTELKNSGTSEEQERAQQKIDKYARRRDREQKKTADTKQPSYTQLQKEGGDSSLTSTKTSAPPPPPPPPPPVSQPAERPPSPSSGVKSAPLEKNPTGSKHTPPPEP